VRSRRRRRRRKWYRHPRSERIVRCGARRGVGPRAVPALVLYPCIDMGCVRPTESLLCIEVYNLSGI
jgi:hypothetical protein